jgi:hypothetical protein
LNAYLVYLLDSTDPLFSEPNLISMLIPYDVRWYGDAGDLLKLNPGSGAALLGGTQQKGDRRVYEWTHDLADVFDS